jgi:hypothetical protein
VSHSCLLHSRNSTKLDEVVKNKWDSFTPHITKFTDVDKYFVKLGEERLVFSTLHGTFPKNISLVLAIYLVTVNRMLPTSGTYRGLSDLCVLLL